MTRDFGLTLELRALSPCLHGSEAFQEHQRHSPLDEFVALIKATSPAQLSWSLAPKSDQQSRQTVSADGVPQVR